MSVYIHMCVFIVNILTVISICVCNIFNTTKLEFIKLKKSGKLVAAEQNSASLCL